MNYVKNNLFMACFIFVVLSATPQAINAKEKPNIIIILTDDQSYKALGASGNSIIKTPHLDQLASEGINFSNANVTFALCSPSRASILTGHYGSQNGVIGLGGVLNRGEKTIAQHLKAGGYTTAITGKWHIDNHPSDVGFDFHVYFTSNGTYYGRRILDMGAAKNPTIHCDDFCAQRGIDFIREQAQGTKPFFLFYCTQTPHVDHQHRWNAQDSSKAKYNINDMPVPANLNDDLSNKPDYLKTVRNLTQAQKYGYPQVDTIKKHFRDYFAVITETDEFIGKVLKEVQSQNIEDNTYIFFLSDNGWMIGDHGFTSKVLPYKPSTHIPFSIKGPSIAAGTNSSIVLNIDLLPTVLDFAGIPIPADVHGKSLLPILSGATSKVRDYFIYEGIGNYGKTQDNITLLNEHHRCIVTYQGTNDALKTIDFLELYDQKNDPWEVKNQFQQTDTSITNNYLRLINKYIQNLPGRMAPPPTHTINHALKKSVRADSFLNPTANPQKAVDGDSAINESRWISQDSPYPHFLEVDFGALTTISYFRFWTGWNGYNRPIHDFSFQIWQNNQWINIHSVYDNPYSYYSKLFNPISTEKARLHITAGTDNMVRLYEFEVYGPDSSTVIKRPISGHFSHNLLSVSNYPNPFKDHTKITYSLATPAEVDCRIVNALGKTIYHHFKKHHKAGRHTLFWDGNSDRGAVVPEGIYFATITMVLNNQSIKETRGMLCMR